MSDRDCGSRTCLRKVSAGPPAGGSESCTGEFCSWGCWNTTQSRLRSQERARLITGDREAFLDALRVGGRLADDAPFTRFHGMTVEFPSPLEARTAGARHPSEVAS